MVSTTVPTRTELPRMAQIAANTLINNEARSFAARFSVFCETVSGTHATVAAVAIAADEPRPASPSWSLPYGLLSKATSLPLFSAIPEY